MQSRLKLKLLHKNKAPNLGNSLQLYPLNFFKLFFLILQKRVYSQLEKIDFALYKLIV